MVVVVVLADLTTEWVDGWWVGAGWWDGMVGWVVGGMGGGWVLGGW